MVESRHEPVASRNSPLLDRARAWMAGDPDAETRAELRALVDAGDLEALEQRFSRRLSFGTAGIRGLLGAGPARMNRAMARLVAAGLGRVLLERVPNAAERGVAVGYDARVLSREMADDVCGVLAGSGVPVHLLAGANPTPLLAFAVVDLGAAAGVMVTASHNPPEYNGIKVYWQDGAQIVPPVDSEISSAIDAVGSVAAVAFVPPEEARRHGLLEETGAGLEERYLEAIDAQAPARRATGAAPGPRFVYTPLHGVGWRLTRRAFERRGLSDVSVVASQAEPDGRFPTVRFPNPEEPGALEAAVEQARREDVGLILAHDPDADRLAVVCRDAGGRYRQLSGDQVGSLFGYHLLDRRRASGNLPDGSFVVTTIVSSSQLARIADLYGVRCELTLTGLKWIWNRALALERQGGTFIFGYEEALGYSVGPAVRDKDGIGAGLVLAELASELASAGRSLLDLLDELDARAGVAETRQVTVPLPPAESGERVARLLERLRRDPPALGGFEPRRLLDFERGERVDLDSRRSERIDLPSSAVAQLDLEGGRTVKLRPSGTEPKLKIYLEASEPPTDRNGVAGSRARAGAALDALEGAVEGLLAE